VAQTSSYSSNLTPSLGTSICHGDGPKKEEEEEKKKICYIYTMEYYSAIKRNEITLFATAWMNLEIIILSKVSETEKDNYHIFYKEFKK